VSFIGRNVLQAAPLRLKPHSAASFGHGASRAFPVGPPCRIFQLPLPNPMQDFSTIPHLTAVFEWPNRVA